MRYTHIEGVIKKQSKLAFIAIATIYAVAMTMSFAFGADARGGRPGASPAPDKVDICHYSADEDTYHMINISTRALDKHVENHGDGEPGEAVPTMDEGYYFTEDCAVEFVRSAEITSPLEGYEFEVGEVVDLAATLVDQDMDDSVNWAVRDNCTFSGTNYVGNVGGLNTPFDWDGMYFSSSFDTAGLDTGAYCFIFNPTETPGVDIGDLRKVVNFELVNADVSGDWTLSVNGGAHLHDMTLAPDEDGVLTGTGSYPAGSSSPSITWTATGLVDGDSVSLSIAYDSSTYTADITGSYDHDTDSMSGGPGTGFVVDWTATR